MGRSRSATAPSAHDQQVKAVVGALSPPSFDLTKLRRQAANSEDVRPIRASKRDLALAFGSAPRLGQLVWRAKWLRERSVELMTTAALLLMEKLQPNKATRQRRPSVTLRLLALTAFAEFVETGRVIDGERQVLGEVQRARNLGMDFTAFNNGWAPKYRRALELLATAEEQTSIAIDLRLGKPQHRVRVSDGAYPASVESDSHVGGLEQDQAKATPADGPE